MEYYQHYPIQSLDDRVAFVTGVSSGIGLAVAKALLIIGVHVIGVARRQERLEEIAEDFKELKGNFHPLRADVRIEEEILSVLQFAHDEYGGVDIVVNNAGVAYMEPITNGSTEHYRDIIETNAVAPAVIMREGIKAIQSRGNDGHIVNIASVVGLEPEVAPVPLSLYEASKVALHVIAKKVRQEIIDQRLPIRMTTVYPTIVRTEFVERAGADPDEIFEYPHIQAVDVAASIIFCLILPPAVEIEMIVPKALHGRF